MKNRDYSPQARKARRQRKQRREEALALAGMCMLVPVAYMFFYLLG